MKPEEKVSDALMLIGFALVVGGVAAIHWPTALIVAGGVLLLGARRAVQDGAGKEEGKP